MFEAAQRGRVDDYLACFTGDLRASLEKNAGDMSEQGFSDYLVSISEPVVGFAVSDIDSVTPGVVTVRVELVYRNKNEVQTCTLQDERGFWKITAMTAAQRIKTLIPYGQKVYEFAPDTTAGAVEQTMEPQVNAEER